jgi:hypothetical protein
MTAQRVAGMPRPSSSAPPPAWPSAKCSTTCWARAPASPPCTPSSPWGRCSPPPPVRGAAALSTALNSNTVNVVAGLLVPATVLGLAQPPASGLLIGGWYAGITALTLLLAYLGRGLRRSSGWLIIAAYALLVAAVLAST